MSEVVAMLANLQKVKIIAGKSKVDYSDFLPFDNIILDFISDLSVLILKNKKLRIYPDLITFGFWCRKSNIINLKKKFFKNEIKKNIGLIFHIPPTNVPISLGYSFVFGLLSGNSNIIRVPRPNLENINEFLKIVIKLMELKKYSKIKRNNTFIEYKNSLEISSKISSLVDGRIIWGGNQTSKIFKEMKTKVSCKDIFFFDKFSFSLIDLKKFKSLNSYETKKLIENFYNDTFVMDQNACSSPHLVLWKNFKLSDTKLFWNKLDKYVNKKYLFKKENKIYKYYRINEILLKSNNILSLINYKNIKIFNLKDLNNNLTDLRGYGGIFFQYKFNNFKNISKIFDRKFQTMTYFGINKQKLKYLLNSTHLNGIDRVVPVGNAINFNNKWDGYEILNELTRIVDFN